MITLIHADLSRAALGKSDGNSSVCGGSVEDCLIADNLEFLMDSHVSRMLLDTSKLQTANTGNPNRPAVDCPKDKGYRSCTPSRNPNVPRQQCAAYTRNC
ncbi:hypothetical protein L6164_006672 [Bauhinia variegata]|nr:hypothetical protein L6164_006672 [Bauhinia variegata]